MKTEKLIVGKIVGRVKGNKNLIRVIEIDTGKELTLDRFTICGEVMLPMWGAGWDNDRMECTDPDCGAEIVFPTSKAPEEE